MAKSLQMLINERFGTPTGESGRTPTVSVATTVTVVLPADPNRLAFTLVNLGSNPVYVTPSGEPSTSLGIRLGAGGGFLTLLWDEDFWMVGREWRGLSDVAASTVFRVEVIAI